MTVSAVSTLCQPGAFASGNALGNAHGCAPSQSHIHWVLGRGSVPYVTDRPGLFMVQKARWMSCNYLEQHRLCRGWHESTHLERAMSPVGPRRLHARRRRAIQHQQWLETRILYASYEVASRQVERRMEAGVEAAYYANLPRKVILQRRSIDEEQFPLSAWIIRLQADHTRSAAALQKGGQALHTHLVLPLCGF